MPEESTEPLIADWVHLPVNLEDQSLWDCLHDASLVSVRSDLLARTVALEFEIGYLQEFHMLPADLRFLLRFGGAQSVRLLRYESWPGPFSVPPGTSRAEESRLIADYHAKSRQESGAWPDFERQISAENSLEVLESAVVESAAGSVALRLGGMLDSGGYHEVYIRAERLDVERSDHVPLGIGQFKELGEQYWTAFAQRSKR
jgi:hypothetical protein